MVPFISIACTDRHAAKPPRAATFLSTIVAAVSFGAVPFVSVAALNSGCRANTRMAQNKFALRINRFSLIRLDRLYIRPPAPNYRR
jgi:hypothetical protein